MNMSTLSLDERTVGEIAAENPVSIRVFEAWRIDYCCGGTMPLQDACERVGKTLGEFATALEKETALEPVSRDWSSQSLTGIANGIVESYHGYTRAELAALKPLAAKVLSVHGERRPELRDAVRLIAELTNDMLPHMLKEEQILFPHVARLEEAADNGTGAPIPFFGTVRNPVRMMMLEHDRVGELLAELRAVTGQYVPPESACFSYRELYRRLSEFERQTHEHVHVENNIYFPRAVDLEERCGTTADFGPAHACGTSSCA
jgi:regulator of cell morphogenesis and NO signaling